MDVYNSVLDYLSDQHQIGSWPELQNLLQRAASARPRGWRLPVLACEAVCEREEPALPAASAVACLETAIILIDDLLDSDPRGEYRRIGAAALVNLATAMQAAGLEAVMRSEAELEVQLAALRALNQMTLSTAFGQHLDIQNPTDEAAYWRVTRTKSSPFYGAALYVGALFGGASVETAEQLDRFGRLYGEMIQIHDDLNDVMAIPANPDWVQGRSSLPILFAHVVDHPERVRFLELRQAISDDPEALSEAQTILIRCGAVSYCVDQLLHRHRMAAEILEATSLARRGGLEALLEEIVNPVWELFREVGVEQPESLENPLLRESLVGDRVLPC